MTGLTWAQVERHLMEANIVCVTPLIFDPAVVIRTDTADHGIASIHMDNGKLVIDMGRKLP